MSTRICSWHFPEGKLRGPTRFAWSVNQSFNITGMNADIGTGKTYKSYRSLWIKNENGQQLRFTLL